MKKNLFALFFALLALYSGRAKSDPCNFSDLVVQFNYAVSAGTVVDSCDINFDLNFKFDHNNGNKRLFIHFWTDAGYPNPPLTYANQPTAAELVQALGTIGIEDPGGDNTIRSTYIVPGVKMLFTGLTLDYVPGNPDQFFIHNITLRVPGPCSGAPGIKADAWATQANSINPVHCSTSGVPILLNNTVGVLAVNCADPAIPNDPQTYDLNLTTLADPPGLSVSFTLWIDNGDDFFDAGTDIQIGGTSGPYVISNVQPLSLTDVPYLMPINPQFNLLRDRTVWLVVTVPGFPNLILSRAPSACSLLPVKLASFTAVRKGKEVYLEWKTALEASNAGFALEKLNKNGSVETIGKVPSQAPDGSSSTGFTYRFEHLNLSSTTTQYRLKQTSRDGSIAYSEIRLVNGISGFRGAYVYPNPASGGKLRIFFDDAAGDKQLSLIDNTGRVIKQVTSKNVSQTEMAVPFPGVYHLSIVLPATGERMVQKVVVNN